MTHNNTNTKEGQVNRLPLQETSQEIWQQKYCLLDAFGNPVDASVDETLDRVAKAIAQVEKKSAQAKWTKLFRDAIENGAYPAGRIMSNAGAKDHKSDVSLINCTVSDSIPDSMDGIFDKVKEAALTLKTGAGIGYEFSTLRPRGAYVSGAGAATSGPMSFMDVYDKMCGTIASAGGRRGAQMATFDVTHPDTLDFIKAKREDGRLRNFNLSLLITDKFMQAVKNNTAWQFEWQGQPFGEAMPAQKLWDTIMDSTYNFAEPGFLLIDKINKFNNLWFCEHLRATNPCGEQPLPPYGSCLLGSINLTMFVINPFTAQAYFDFAKFRRIVGVFTRMLDNVVEINGLPLARQREEILTKRRHGMGYLGLGSAITMLGMYYGDQKSVEFTEQVTRILALTGFQTGSELAEEKGEADVLQAGYSKEQIASHLKYNTNFEVSKTKQTVFTGRELLLNSHYFDAWKSDSEALEVLKQVKKHGSRFSHHSSIAPTGTLSLSVANNTSNGIEPSFAHYYVRNVIKEGMNTKVQVPVYSYEYLAYKTLVNPNVEPKRRSSDLAVLGEENYLPRYFTSTDDLTPNQHIDIQAASQKWIDSSISKTINVPTDTDRKDFQDIYMYAYDKGLKGCTTFRFNPEAFTGVLVKPEDLQNTLYTFVLETGETVELSGDRMVEYDGQQQTASNLFDAIKEKTFGKFSTGRDKNDPIAA